MEDIIESYIYKITNTINNKIYIGQSNGFIKNYLGSGKKIKEAIKIFGKNSFKKEMIISGFFNFKLINELERHYIRLYNSNNKEIGYNKQKGGKNMWGGKKERPVNQYSIEGALLNQYESIKEASLLFGVNTRSIGKCCNRAIITVKNTIFRYKDDLSILDRPNKRRRPIYSIDKIGNINKYESCLSASKEFKCDASTINKCLIGKNKTSQGLEWRYQDGIY